MTAVHINRPSAAKEGTHAAVERALRAVLPAIAPEARAVGQAVQGHLNETLATFLHPKISFRVELAPFVTAEVDRVLRESRRAALTELSQCAIELQEAANLLRPVSATGFAIFDVAAQRVRSKVAAAERSGL